VDAVIKVGGSLTEHPDALRALCVYLQKLAEKYSIVVVPGGGKFADIVRELDEKFHLPSAVSHKLAILAMDQYGLVLTQVIPDAQASEVLGDAQRIAEMKKVPVFLPSKLMFKDDPFEASWDATSDSIAAYVALKLQASRLILVTDVDGVFAEDPKKNRTAKLISEISTHDLLAHADRTAVDMFLPKFLSQHALECYVVNGLYPERVGAVLSGRRTVGTRITAE
jgi:5-(aminomethyl)-3-furanmethanol phosphate kinase